jgi:LysR family transcriptional regulator, nitrogen assimilation regulatory protein
LDLRQIRYFLHAATTLNLTHASGKAAISQSALSRQIKLLEDDLGVTLFERKARGLQLTIAGNSLVARAQLLLEDADELKRVARSNHSKPAGTLRIGTPSSLRSELMRPFFIEFHRRYPEVLLVHSIGTAKGMRDALAEGELDIAVTSSVEALESFFIEKLFSEPLCWIGPYAGKKKNRQFLALERLVGHPVILTSYPNSLRIILDRKLATLGLRVSPIAELDNSEMMLDLVNAGFGFTVLPSSGARQAELNNLISVQPIRGLAIEWVAARSKERTQTNASKQGFALLKEIAEKIKLKR